MSLVKESREFLIDFALEIFAGQQSFKTSAQECDRTFQLMGGIRGISCRSLQFLTGRGKRGFGTFSLRAIFFRVQCELLDGYCETGRDEVASHQPAEQKQRARAANSPTKPMQLRHRIGERVNANLVRRREERIWIESLIKQKMRRSVYCYSKVVLRRSGIRECFCYFPAQSSLRGFRKQRQMQVTVYPDPILHSRTGAFPG